MCSSTCSRGHAHASDKQTKDCEELIMSQVTPLLGTLKSNGVLLATTSWGEGLPAFASAVAGKLSERR